MNNFSGRVSLQAESFPPGVTLSLDRNWASLAPHSGDSVIITAYAPQTIPEGGYDLVVTGTSGQLVIVGLVSAFVESRVGLKISPETMKLAQGSRGIFTVTATSHGGFIGNFTVSPNCYPPELSCQISQSTLTFTSTITQAQAVLTVTVPASMFPGYYGIRVDGKVLDQPWKTDTARARVTVTGPDFSVSASPDTLTFAAGRTGSLTSVVTLVSLSAFQGNINVSSTVARDQRTASAGFPRVTPTGTVVNLGPGWTESFAVTITVDSSIGPGR